MKKLILAITLFAQSLYGQKITHKEARQLIDKTIESLKKSDTATFIGLWGENHAFEDCKTSRETHQREFAELKIFLDTALAQNLKIANIEIEKLDIKQDHSQYNIKAWFEYNKNYNKGIGLFLTYADHKWVVCLKPETSILQKG